MLLFLGRKKIKDSVMFGRYEENGKEEQKIDYEEGSFLKGQSHEIFHPQFFSSINTPRHPDSWAKAVSNINSYSRRYSIMYLIFSLSYPKIFCFILQTIGREDPQCINF
jgi:hypothetical protein